MSRETGRCRIIILYALECGLRKHGQDFAVAAKSSRKKGSTAWHAATFFFHLCVILSTHGTHDFFSRVCDRSYGEVCFLILILEYRYSPYIRNAGLSKEARREVCDIQPWKIVSYSYNSRSPVKVRSLVLVFMNTLGSFASVREHHIRVSFRFLNDVPVMGSLEK